MLGRFVVICLALFLTLLIQIWSQPGRLNPKILHKVIFKLKRVIANNSVFPAGKNEISVLIHELKALNTLSTDQICQLMFFSVKKSA